MHARFYKRASQIVSTNPPLLELLANHLKCMCMGAGTCIVLFTLVTWRLEQCLSERVLNTIEWTGWISLKSKGLSRVFSNTTVQKRQFFGTQLSSQSNYMGYPYILVWKNIEWFATFCPVCKCSHTAQALISEFFCSTLLFVRLSRIVTYSCKSSILIHVLTSVL